jgi:hypothetical protein
LVLLHMVPGLLLHLAAALVLLHMALGLLLHLAPGVRDLLEDWDVPLRWFLPHNHLNPHTLAPHDHLNPQQPASQLLLPLPPPRGRVSR